jgi:hypothetical protein
LIEFEKNVEKIIKENQLNPEETPRSKSLKIASRNQKNGIDHKTDEISQKYSNKVATSRTIYCGNCFSEV